MSGFIVGEDRNQVTLFPERLNGYLANDSSVQVIDFLSTNWIYPVWASRPSLKTRGDRPTTRPRC